MKKTLLFLCGFLIALPLLAQENRLFPKQPNTSEIFHNIERLGFLGTALYIAAHPDDENTRLISYLSNHRMARTAYLSLTRGDGGQNLIGPQLREQLGMIRTQELLEARNIDGGQQFFTRANDFGYSKHPDETFEIWDEDKVLDDVIKVIREFKPDVIINRFNHRTPGTTHGHHTGSAMISYEAFDKAASNYKVPGLNLAPWKTGRLYFNTSWWFYGSRENFDKADKTNLLELTGGVYYPWIGKSNGEIASLSRSEHKSQGFGSSGSRDEQIEYLEYLKGSFPDDKEDLFSGINTTWSRVNGGDKIQDQLTKVISEYDFSDPEASLPHLIQLHKMISALDDKHWKPIKLEELEQIILDINGIYFTATTNGQQVTAGQTVPVSIEFTNRSCMDMDVEFVWNANLHLEKTKRTVDAKSSEQITTQLSIPEEAYATTPYYLVKKGTLGMYAVSDNNQIGYPELPLNFGGYASIDVGDGLIIKKYFKVHFKTTDPVRGEIHEPLNIVPSIAVSIDNPVYIFKNSESQQIPVTVKAHENTAAGTVELCGPNDWNITPATIALPAMKSGEVTTYSFKVTPPDGAARGLVSGLVKTGSESYSKEVISIDYDHIPDQQLVRNNEAQVVQPGLENSAQTVAYINGAGDDVATAIEAIGSKVFRYNPDEVPADLSKYDAVMIGIRAYNVAPTAMAAMQQSLDTYVKNGGTLIMQYNTSRRISPDALGPLSITLSRKRVTDENAAVTILNPKHPLLSTPNQITDADFENWVQERGLYFPTEWDSAFTPLLGMNDKGEEMTKGSLIVADYGKGHIVYTGLSLFRELPAGVSGAYRLLANMISLGTHGKQINTTTRQRF